VSDSPTWRPSPKPGSMKMCGQCPHLARGAEVVVCRLAVAPKVPPLTRHTRDGKEYCGMWPPKDFANDHQAKMFEEASA